MAEIRNYPIVRHIRTEPTCHVLRYRNGKLVANGRGKAFWFMPMGAAIAEIPVDDRELQIFFRGKAKDFQQVAVQGGITFRVADPEVLAQRIDFTLDLRHGTYVKEPLDQLAGVLTGRAQQLTVQYLAEGTVKQLLEAGLEPIQERLQAGLLGDEKLRAMGIEVVAARVLDMAPTAELEKALQTPTLEALQQQADEAIFERRAMAVEKERAIAENELKNQIELAKREENLIDQRGQNQKRVVTEEAEANRITADATAKRDLVTAEAKAKRIALIEGAKTAAEKDRMAIYRDLPVQVMMGLAAQELAAKLQTIEHLNITPDMLGPLFTNLVEVGTKRLGQEA